MMMKLVGSLVLLASATTAFAPVSLVKNAKPLSMAKITPEDVTYFEDLELAVRAALNVGMCTPEELDTLADKVEAGAESCVWEVDEELCQKEIDDRKDVAEVLRMQAELQLRMDCIEKTNLFAADVIAEEEIREREDVMEALAQDGL